MDYKKNKMSFKYMFEIICAFGLITTLIQARAELDCKDFELRGIYVSASEDILHKVMKAKKLNINAVVIDIKNDEGEITCNLDDPKIKYTPYIKNIKQLLTKLKSMGIYTIARIVTFKDKFTSGFTDKKFAIKNKDGTIYVDEEKMSWINPYNKAVWQYLGEIVEATAKLGFNEIQFDYIRLPQYKSLEQTSITQELQTKSKTQIINEFLDFIIPKIHAYGTKISADVFGCIIPESLKQSALSSEKLGQDYIGMTEKVDYICPMIYPSHWPAGSLGVEKPDINPGKIVQYAMEYSNKALKNKKNKSRPWIQAFTATWLKRGLWQAYKLKQLQEQVDALRRLGIRQFCFWNPTAKYEF